MGCKQSTLREDGTQINPEHLPQVPVQCWYAHPFDEYSLMPVTAVHQRSKGKVVFSRSVVPTREAELEALPGGVPQFVTSVDLARDNLYGMAYLHQTALFTEHLWRTRVTHSPPKGKFDRPFFDMLLGVKVFFNNIMVPDSFPFDESLSQCTSTYCPHEGTKLWKAVPIVLMPKPDCFTIRNLIVYAPLVFSFLRAGATLNDGEHIMRVEVVYGCKSENNFCTEFIARGNCMIQMNEAARTRMSEMLTIVQSLLEMNPSRARSIEATDRCVYCGHALKWRCTICHARICRQQRCVWASFSGYPYGCMSHAVEPVIGPPA